MTRPFIARPLHILIAGGGIGGLTAAIALRKAGHHVEIFEQSSFSHETGAAVHLAPNANGLLRRLGLMVEDLGAVECLGSDIYSADTALQESAAYGHSEKTWGHPWHLVHRQSLHTALREMALSADGEGEPVKLRLSRRVKCADPDTATLVFEDGSHIKGDLIIGADGVHSRTRKAIPGGDLTPFDSGKSAYRFLIPTSRMASNPLTAQYVSKPGCMVMWTKAPKVIVMYPCHDGDMMNFVAIHPSNESDRDAAGSTWTETGNKEVMLKIYEEFAPSVLAFLEMADASKLKVWNLLDMDQMPSFVKENLAVLGDAAHPFLPHQAQGAGQAIEDAISLSVVLPLGTPIPLIPERLRLYEKCRYKRSHKIQENTRLTGRGGSMQTAFSNFIEYNFSHDEYENSTRALEEHMTKA